MKIAYIAHPVGGNVQKNLASILKIVRDINLNEPDVVPFAPYWVDCHALDDRVQEERDRGIKNDQALFRAGFIDEVRLYGTHISRGMQAEIDLATRLGIPVRGMTRAIKHLLGTTIL